MSISIAIGSDVQDLRNIETTIELLNFTKNIASSSTLSLSNGQKINFQDLEHIIDWYTGIHNILTNPAFFSLEESLS